MYVCMHVCMCVWQTLTSDGEEVDRDRDGHSICQILKNV